MQLKPALTAAIETLKSNDVPSPRLNAELLLMFVLGCDRTYLFAHPERELTMKELLHYDAALGQRSCGMPAQYITGHQEFWGLDLIVTSAVLIPRPETEQVVESVLEVVRARTGGGQECPPHTVRIVDVGTGSGCIALALAQELSHAEIHATDISSGALEIARANASRHQLEDRIQFHQADLLASLTPPFDFVVSNPPYVGEREEDQVQLEVRKFEPRAAIFAGPTGTEVIARLVPQAYSALGPGGWLIMEISGTIAEEVRRLLKGWQHVQIKPDLQSIPREAMAQKPTPDVF